MFQIKIAEKIRPYGLYPIIFSLKIIPFMRQCGIIFYSQTGHRWQYDVCKLHAG